MEPWGWAWMLVWVAALLVAVWLIVRDPSRPPDEEALTIVRRRFARGEISQAEYERVRDALLADRAAVVP